MIDVLNDQLEELRKKISAAVQQLLDLTREIGHDSLSNTIKDLQDRVLEPFMFVIVGEVKAGKSSFINALLETEEDICKVAPSPMTDTIQQIVYGEPIREEIINPYLKKIYHPAKVLQDIAIVDTPGTNTIIDHHQEITERFIPGADLIVFVFEAKNPYRQSSWNFFDYIHDEWRKKIIFILQQKDLLPKEDLKVNLVGVEKQAKDKGINVPVVFAVSALMEQTGDKAGSGFAELRKFIQDHVTGGRAAVLKLESNVNTSLNIAEKINAGIKLRRKQWEIDQAFRNDIAETLTKQTKISHDQVDVLVENLLAGYDKTLREKSDELSQVLSLGAVLKRSINSIFSKKSSIKEWLTNFAKSLEEDLNSDLRNRLNERVLDLAESIQQMGQIIDLKIRSSETVLKNDHEIFSDIAERRSKVLTELQDTFTTFLQTTDNFTDESIFAQKENLSPTLATGGGIAVVGVLLTIVTNGMVFDVTGGVLTALGLLFASVSLGLQKRKIMNNFRAEIEKGRDRLELEVTANLKKYVEHIRERIEANFEKFDALLASEKVALEVLAASHDRIKDTLHQIESEIKPLIQSS